MTDLGYPNLEAFVKVRVKLQSDQTSLPVPQIPPILSHGDSAHGKVFNTTGPCNPEERYVLPPSERLINAQLEKYIKNKLYWVLHTPRQTGKTTFLLSYMKDINQSGEGWPAT